MTAGWGRFICKGMCTQHKKKHPRHLGRNFPGLGKCSPCGVHLVLDGPCTYHNKRGALSCKCCGCQLKLSKTTKPTLIAEAEYNMEVA